ncbi:unnamed protein product [Spodoptera littoralis]|uniref:Uncharacterized protein n=1 Tax=Spodoptera littoralis TaxID=7109 RepID=A0A9P0IC77_SPOLI|nr:unnamed protein product [Spodoptera littoralis]
MKLTTDIFIVLFYTIAVRLVSARNALKFSKKDINPDKKEGRRMFNTNFEEAYPQPLPTTASKSNLIITRPSIYQGVRFDNDVRVYRQRFEYNATADGQRILCQGMFDCLIAYIAIESSEAIPVLLRGGVGYRHFTAIIKSKPNHDLKGQVRAYCRNKEGRTFTDNSKEKTSKLKLKTTTVRPKRRFVFEELESERDDFDFGLRYQISSTAAPTSKMPINDNKLRRYLGYNRDLGTMV